MLRCDVFEVDSISLIDYILCGISWRSNIMEIVWAILLEKLFKFRFDRQDIFLQIEAPQAVDLAYVSFFPVKGPAVYLKFLALFLWHKCPDLICVTKLEAPSLIDKVKEHFLHISHFRW